MSNDEITENQLNKKRQLELENENKDEEREIDRTKEILDEALDSLEFKRVGQKPQGRIGKFKNWWLRKSLKQKMLTFLAFALSGLLFLVLLIYIWWTGKDAILFKSTLNGKVYDKYEKSIEDVSISIDGEYKTKTDKLGEFEISGLDNGKVKVLLQKNGFESVEKSVTVGRYTTYKEFQMIELPKGSIKARLNMPNGFDPALVEIKVNEKIYEIEDENLQIENLYKGKYKLDINSPEFVDISREIEVLAGENDFGIIDLVPAADIVAQISDWTSGMPIGEIEFDGIDEEFEYENGVFAIRNFEKIDELYSLKFQADTFMDSIEERRVTLGLNDLGKIHLYPQQSIYTISKEAKLVGLKMDLSSTNLTGTNVDDFSAYNFENIRYLNDNVLYNYNSQNNQSQEINKFPRGLIYYNNPMDMIIEIVDDNGEYFVYKNGEKNELTKFAALPTKVLVSDDGKFAYFSFNHENQIGLYQVALEFGTTRQLIDLEVELIAINTKGEQIIYKQSGKYFSYNARIFKSSLLEIPYLSNAIYANNRWYMITDQNLVIMENNYSVLNTLPIEQTIESMKIQGDYLVLKTNSKLYLINTKFPNILQSISYGN